MMLGKHVDRVWGQYSTSYTKIGSVTALAIYVAHNTALLMVNFLGNTLEPERIMK